MTCKSCNGKRFIVRTVPNMNRYGGVDYQSTRPTMVERLSQCERCNGSGHEPDPTPAGYVAFEGLTIHAPGYTDATFAAGVMKARAAGYFHTVPASTPGAVLCDTRTSRGAAYMVSRQECSCQGGRSYGHCYHRAGCIFMADIAGFEVCREEVLGFDPAGVPVCAADRRHELEGQAA